MKISSLAAKMAGVPSIIYRRGITVPVNNSPVNRYLFRRVLTGIIANSEETKRSILAKSPDLVPEDKIKVIYNGIHLDRFNSSASPMCIPEDGEILLGCAGRLSAEKGHALLLELMVILKESTLKCKLLIAGEGKLLEVLKNTARSLGVEQMVEFLGFVDDMPSFYKSLDIFLLSSRYEGFGYVLIEAMASRVPVVAFDVKSTQEIVEHGETGYLVAPMQVGDMADRVLELAGDQALRTAMGERGRKRVEKLFSFEKNQSEFSDLLMPSSL